MNKYYKFFFLCFIGVIIYSCNKAETKKTNRKKIPFLICDSIHYFEQPKWWDDINVYIDDSIMKVSKSSIEYLDLCRIHRSDKLNDDTLYKESYSQYIRYPLKAKYLYNKIKKNSNSSFLHSFSKEVSHDLSIKIKEQLFHCDKKYQNSRTIKEIGDDYLAICDYSKAIDQYNLALEFNKKEKEKESEKDSTKLHWHDYTKELLEKKLTKADEKVKKGNGNNVCSFSEKINVIIENIEDYKTLQKKEQIKAFVENRRVKEILKTEGLDKNTDYFFTSMSNYELALYNLMYEDSKLKKPLIMNPKTVARIKENFKDFNELDHTNFNIGISNIGTLNEDRDEWVISFWSDLENSGGITAVYLKGYEITEMHSVD